MKLEKIVKIKRIESFHNVLEDNYTEITLNEALSHEEFKKISNFVNKKIKITLELEEPILNDAERKYLSGVIKPFREMVVGIYKYSSVLSNYEEIAIDSCAEYNCNQMTHLPLFKKGTMYKNMELNKKYTLEELNL